MKHEFADLDATAQAQLVRKKEVSPLEPVDAAITNIESLNPGSRRDRPLLRRAGRTMILHILKRSEWDEAIRNGNYAPPSLGNEGFIHCSTIEQVVETANLYFRGQPDLMVLSIDEARLVSPLKYEAPASAGDECADSLFPHLYGLLNLDAVDYACEFPCEANGLFELPATLRAAIR